MSLSLLSDIPRVSITSSRAQLAEQLRLHGHRGIIQIDELPSFPFQQLATLFDTLHSSPGVCDSLNSSYSSSGRLIYKDSFAAGCGGPAVDQKRVLDLSTQRIQAIQQQAQCAHIIEQLSDTPVYASIQRLQDTWLALQENVGQKIMEALADAIGGEDSDDILQDVHANFRMVDYYSRPVGSVPPRCGDHRDFGAFSLLFSTQPGLQVLLDGRWQRVGVPQQNSAILMFGWCTEIRSNSRIKALMHRVVDQESEEPNGQLATTRRLAAVLFVAPKSNNTLLKCVVQPNEQRVYRDVKVGQLQANMRRKWGAREGTLQPHEHVLEEEEIRVTQLKTQDDVIQHMVKTQH